MSWSRTCGGFVADLHGVGVDAGEGRDGEFAEGFVVVDADDGDIVGDLEAAAAAERRGLRGRVRRWRRGCRTGLGRVSGAIRRFVVVLFPSRGRRPVFWRGRSGEGEAGLGDDILEVVAAFIEAGVDATGSAAEAVGAEAAVAEVSGGEFADFAVVEADVGDGEGWDVEAEVDGGDAAFEDEVGDFLGIDAGEDAVAFPAGEPVGEGFGDGAWAEIGGPAAVFAVVASDAGEESASVGTGGFDEEGHMSHGGKSRVIGFKITGEIRICKSGWQSRSAVSRGGVEWRAGVSSASESTFRRVPSPCFLELLLRGTCLADDGFRRCWG